jgi:hypothetical protein
MRKRRDRRRGKTAMAMVDAVIAVAVGAAMILAVTAVLIAANSANDVAQQNITAYNAARQVVENLRTFKGAAMAKTANSGATYVDATSYGPVPQLTQLSNGTVQVRILAPRTGSSLRQAVIKVTWTAGDRRRGQGAVSSKTRYLSALFIGNGVAR